MGAQTSESQVAVTKSFLFKNVGKTEVPPYGVMMMVRKEPDSSEDKDTSIGVLLENFGGSLGSEDTGGLAVALCKRPDKAAEFIQDPSCMVFNGPTPVQPGKMGDCSVGSYPAKALAENSVQAVHSLRVKNGSYVLHVATGNYGAYRSAGKLSQVVSHTSESGETLRTPVGFVTPSAEVSHALYTEGDFNTSGNTPAPLLTKNRYGLSVVGGYAFEPDPTVTFLLPGTYRVTINGSASVSDLSSSKLKLPYELRLVAGEGNKGEAVSKTQPRGGSYLSNVTGTLYKVLSDNKQPLESMTTEQREESAEMQKQWQTHAFRLSELITVTKDPYRIGLKQSESQIIKTTGVWSITYYYDEESTFGGFSFPYGWGEFSGYGYGYGYGMSGFWGFGSNGFWGGGAYWGGSEAYVNGFENAQ